MGDRPRRMLEWAHSVFGECVLRRKERALRLLEEAMELAQAEDVDAGQASGLLARVWTRPAGDPVREFDQVAATLETYGALVGISVDEGAEREWRRVQTLDVADLRARHDAKTRQGVTTESKL